MVSQPKRRNTRSCGSSFLNRANERKSDLRNNVFYNWGPTNGGYTAEGGRYNFVNNYYKPGPSTATSNSLVHRIFSPNPDNGNNSQAAGVWGTFHVTGNYIDDTCSKITTSQKSSIASANSNNWNGIHPDTGNGALPGGNKAGIRSAIEYPHESVTTHTAAIAFEKVLEYAGASFARDTIDRRIVRETKEGTFTYKGTTSTNGLIDTQSDVGGWPVLETRNVPLDSNGDGIPDAWANANDLEPNAASNANGYDLSKT